MGRHNRKQTNLITTAALSLLLLTAFSITYADDIPGSVIGRYDDWTIDNSPTVGLGLFPNVTLTEPGDTSLTIEPLSGSGSGSKVSVTISPFTAKMSGQKTLLIAGYVGGARTGVTLTIEGRGGADTGYSDIATIKPDENGLFVWAVPSASLNLNLIRVTAISGTTRTISNAIRLTPSDENAVIEPVAPPVQNVIPMQSGITASAPALTSLTISASSISPKVGDEVTITGRLIDQNGKGVSGVTIAIDETGYPGAAGAEPFATAVTGSDGRFEYQLTVRYANSVGLVASYGGDEKYSSAESNTLSITSHEK